MSEKLTEAQHKALTWIADKEPVSQFPMDGPTMTMVRRLRDANLIESAGKDRGVFGFVRYVLSPAGRQILSDHRGERE